MRWPTNVTLLVALLLAAALSGARLLRAKDAAQQLQPPAAVTPAETSSSGISASALSTEVLYLPGAKKGLPSRHFAGYITVDDVTQRQLYYYLVTHNTESVIAPSSTPLIIWLTGGPGCSSLDAFTYEHGPFKFTAPGAEPAWLHDATWQDIQLDPNPYSWSSIAHVLYIDSPAGTGFSYTPGQKTYHTNDDKTIEDLEVFVSKFFAQHSWLRDQPLYVAGESYGGVYVPLLTRALLRHNQHQQETQHSRRAAQPDSATSSGRAAAGVKYNLAGYIVGNAVTDDVYDGMGQVEFAYGLGLIDPETYHSVKQTCKANNWHMTSHSACAEALEAMEGVMGNINPYDILTPCFLLSTGAQLQVLGRATTQTAATTGSNTIAKRGVAADRPLESSRRRLKQLQKTAGQQRLQGPSQVFESAATSASGCVRLRAAQHLRHAISCADRRYAMVYYNSAEVRRAMHAASEEESGRWEPCSDVLNYTHTVGSMIPIHKELLDAGVRGLVLSGDHDYVVPYTGTRAWIYDMHLRQTKPWHSWTSFGTGDQVAGYAVEFEAGLTFASVKGAGHMVPQTHPYEARELIKLWLSREL